MTYNLAWCVLIPYLYNDGREVLLSDNAQCIPKAPLGGGWGEGAGA